MSGGDTPEARPARPVTTARPVPPGRDARMRERERALLHAGGTPGTWGNLGLWPAPDYAHACAALARRVGRAAELQPGARVLSVGCGAGDELALWTQEFGSKRVLGLEPDLAAAAAAARFVGPDGDVLTLPWWALASQERLAGAFDAVVCIDAAYHFSPRPEFLAAAWQALRPGGRLAFTDLVLEPPAPESASGMGWGTWARRLAQRASRAGQALVLRGAARQAGVRPADLLDGEAAAVRLGRAGFTQVCVERLDQAVLEGFAAFARRQRKRLGPRARDPAWRRVATTARLLPACQAAGLGMVLLAGSRPWTEGTGRADEEAAERTPSAGR